VKEMIVKNLVTQDWRLISVISFQSNKDKEAVKASNKKHEEKSFKIHFVVNDLNWACLVHQLVPLVDQFLLLPSKTL
jgi:hypothetical protein